MDADGIDLLILEDEPAHAEAIRRALESPGGDIRIRTAASLLEYRAAVAAAPPAVVLADMILPDGRATEILTHPAEEGPFPVLVMTSYGNEETAVEAMRAGALDYVVKSPESFAAMPRILEHAMREWRLLRDRRRARDEALRASRDWQLTFDSTNDAIWILDTDNRVLRSNRMAERLFGRPCADLIGKRCWEIVHGTAEPIPECPILRARRSLLRETMELQIGDKWLEVTVDPILDSSGGYAGAVHIVSEISLRKRAEEALRQSQERYRSLVDNSLLGITVIDRNFRIISVNATFAKLFHKSPDAFIGKHCYGEFEKRPAVCPHCPGREAMASGITQEVETQGVRDDGKHFYVRLRALPLFGEGREVTGFIEIVENIDAQKRAEHALMESESKYRSLFDKAMDGICVADAATGIIVECNEALASLAGRDRSELIGQPQRILHPKEHWVDRLSKTFLEHCAAKEGQLIETQLITKSGETRDVEIKANTLKISGRKVLQGIFHDISERKRSMEALRSSRQILAEIMNSIPARVFWKDRNLVYMGCNTAFARDAGFSGPDEVIGRDDYRMGWRAQAEQYRADDRQVIESGIPKLLIEEPQTTPDGRTITLLTSKIPLRGAGGEIVGVLGTYVDITERKKAETALRESEARLSYLSKYANDFIFLVDEDFRVIETNERVTDFYGYSREELRGMRATRLRAPEARAEFAAQIGRARKTGSSLFETIHQRKDGTKFPVEINLRAIDIGGKRLYQAVIRDITQRKRDEAALRESEALLNEVGRVAKIGGWKMDLVTRKATWTRETYEIAEIPHGAPIPGPDEHVGFYLPEYRAMVAEAMRALIEDDLPLDFEARLRTAKGNVIWCRAIGRARRRDGKAYEVYGTFQDITERKEAEGKEREMERRLLHAQKLESMGVLAGGIAHDFNNLLTAILGNLDLSLDELSPVSPARQTITTAIAAVKHAEELTRQMLAYSGKGRFIISDMDLSELVKENVHILKAAIGTRIQLKLDLEEKIPLIAADAGQVQQVVMNLITNASESIEEGNGIVALSTGAEECSADYLSRSQTADKPSPGRYVYLEVTDTGCGMDEETRQRLFDPFFTTKFTGRGLGMAAVQGIVQGHKGAIFVESAPGKGTTIRVIFPASGSRRADSPGGEAKTAVRAEQRAHAAGAVLIVDDDEMVRAPCAAMAEHLGYRVFTAGSGEEAITVLRKHAARIRVAILDLTMPGMDGVATFEALRRIRPDLRVILSSGYNEQDATERFAGRGLAGFIKKPYDMETLAAKLAQAAE